MTVFRQENVDDYYDTGEELGRYRRFLEALATGLWECIMLGAVGGEQMQLESGVSLTLPGDSQIVEKRVTL